MTTPSSETPDGQKPPRSNNPPSKGSSNLEFDLWDFDDELDLQDQTGTLDTQSSVEGALPQEDNEGPVVLPVPASHKQRTLKVTPRQGTTTRPKLGSDKSADSIKGNQRDIALRKPTDDIGELDDGVDEPLGMPSHLASVPLDEKLWEEEPSSGEVDESIAADVGTPEVVEESGETSPLVARDSSLGDQTWQEDSEIPITGSPDAGVKSLVPRLTLSSLEKIGLGALVASLAIAGILLFGMAKKSIPADDGSGGIPEFPVRGTFVTLETVESFWREPILGQDTVRSNTRLIPVALIRAEGSGAIRIFFRNERGETMGDSVTRSVSGGQFEVAATAGLTEITDHTLYRTGDLDPWQLEIWEAGSVNAARSDFQKIATIPLSNNRQ